MGTWVKKRWDKGKMLSGLRPAFFLSIVMCFMIFMFAPLEIYLGNRDEFWYDAYILFPFLIKDFLFFAAVSLVMFILAYLLGNFLYNVALYGYFTAFLACYIQGNYLVNNLPPFDGTEVQWEWYRSEMIRDLIIWLVIAIVILVLVIVLKTKKFAALVSAVSIFFLLMLGSTLGVLGISGGLLEPKNSVKFLRDGQFEMSTDKNFIILVLDSVDETCFWQVWENHPEYEEAMADFTFYNNTMSGYAYTKHSVPLIISGEWFENNEPFNDYLKRVYADSPLFHALEEQGYSLRFYDDIQVEQSIMDEKFANMVYTRPLVEDSSLFNSRIIKMTGVKYAPYFLKPYCWFNPDKLNYQQGGFPQGEELFVWTNDSFYEDVKADEITYTDDRQFKWIHLMGAHVPFVYDQYVNEVEDADYYTCIEASMTVTMAYLDKLKKAGVYDNSIILVLSDHGFKIPENYVSISEYERQHSILFVKGLNEHHDMQISAAPISHEDLVGAYDKLLEGHLSDECFEYQEGDYRERRYILYKGAEENHMVEYLQTGNEKRLHPTLRQESFPETYR